MRTKIISVALFTAWTTSAEAQDVSGPDPTPAYAGARATHTEPTTHERFASRPYMERYKPEPFLWEVGLYGGALFPSTAHNLKVSVLPREEYSAVSPTVAGSLAFFPLTWLGVEIETMVAGAKLRASDYSAMFYGGRAHGVLQLPVASVVPFAFVGGGFFGASSETMGHDRDPLFHFGGGLKIPFNHLVGARLDVRDNLTQKGNRAAQGKQTHHPELHLGVSFTFERTPPTIPREDRDYDGLYDHEDFCADRGALTENGCPLDSDNDSFVDPDDACPAEVGIAPDGCPERDSDGDGVPVPADQCPAEVGPAPSGCPDKDIDGDGFVGADDKCPREPETRNGFEDKDGCPDVMPEAISKFTGVIRGITFKQGTADIEESSHAILDAAVEILIKFPEVRIEVSGHTSSEGTPKRNEELSVERAEAVKQYMVSKGVDTARVVARGAGPSEPIADNETNEGRKQNRRIEFRVLPES